MSKKVKEKKTPPPPPPPPPPPSIPIQEGSRFEGLSGTKLQREIEKQIEEKRIAREQRLKEARIGNTIEFAPPSSLNNGILKRKSFHLPSHNGG